MLLGRLIYQFYLFIQLYFCSTYLCIQKLLSRLLMDRIKEAIKFMHEQYFEVPFIATYRKEYVQGTAPPSLLHAAGPGSRQHRENISYDDLVSLDWNDLWNVYRWDEKWTQLSTRRTNQVIIGHS